jgi:NAD-dependent deacetylase
LLGPLLGRASAQQSRSAERLAELLRSSERAVVLTGAGISVPSGIPDFRTPGKGLWEKVNPMEVAHIDAFRRDPDTFWKFYGDRFASLKDVKHNRAHEVVAELERRGLVKGVITQNIDRLHRTAGTQNLIEMHGTIEWSVCPECRGKVGIDDVMKQLAEHEGAPECQACVAALKPDVVLFGEMLPQKAMLDAHVLASEADLMIAIGSSLEVYPVASLPQIAMDAGARLALVTQGPTPYDREADVRLTGDVVEELEAVLAAL